jgi:hypothetical protein
MAVTYRQVLNTVIGLLSETEIAGAATTLDTYQKLVALFVNQIKEEIEDAHNWRSLRSTVTVVVDANTNEEPLTGTNERSRVVRYRDQQAGHKPLVFDVTTPSQPIPLLELDLADMIYRETIDTQSSTQPIFFAIDNTTGDVPSIRVYPTPSVNRTIQATLVVPQARLTEANLDTAIRIPTRPLEIGALWFALKERGEELGINGLFTEERFRNALADAIARDDTEQGGTYLVVE